MQQNSETKTQEAGLRIKMIEFFEDRAEVTFEIQDQPDHICRELVEVVYASPPNQGVDYICSTASVALRDRLRRLSERAAQLAGHYDGRKSQG